MELNIFLLLCVLAVTDTSYSLQTKFVAAIFRHGDRAPESNGDESYPTDPHKNNNYYPAGPGGITNNGKLREYNLGRALRMRYNNFLGDIYLPNEVKACSTDFDRTKMSLLLVLSGLYPPKKSQIWNPYLNWQPIPINYQPIDDDIVLQADRCPQYKEEFEKVLQLPEVQVTIEALQPLMENLTILTGKTINTTGHLSKLYHTFAAQSEMKLELPSWAHSLYPYGGLFEGIILDYNIKSYNNKLKKFFGGTVLRNIINTMVQIVENKNTEKKIHLFSGHESNIVALLKTLGAFKPHVPNYGSCIIFELLNDSSTDEFYVKVHYYSDNENMVTIKFPGCEIACSLVKFIKLVENVMPSDDEMICK